MNQVVEHLAAERLEYSFSDNCYLGEELFPVSGFNMAVQIKIRIIDFSIPQISAISVKLNNLFQRKGLLTRATSCNLMLIFKII